MDSRENGIEDLGEEVPGYDARVCDLTARDKLQFAKWVLKGIFIFFLVSIGVFLVQSTCGEALLDIGRTGLLPMASFVIGDYFGSRAR
jgi:hypothetical protein